ncbi:MAG: hypothetical protein LH606_18100 [Cytophagaceae bacterium]|nr:hypothetical protein [Cytophagaceae bacterium]
MNDDDLLDPLKGLQRAEPNLFLFTRIEARLVNRIGQCGNVHVSPVALRLTLAGLALLSLINVLALRSQSDSTDRQTDTTDYQLSTANYRLY